MARTTKQAVKQPADMKDILWKAADKLRGSMDAAEYKHFVLGLVFLKYVSDSFDERKAQIRQELEEEGAEESEILAAQEDRDEYLGQGYFYIPSQARWVELASNAKAASGSQPVGQLIDGVMDQIEKLNPDLLGVLPKIYNRTDVDERRLGELVDLIGRIGFQQQGKQARDVLGEVYEYFLDKFAKAEGKRGGEYYTPASVVRLLVEILAPQPGGRVYDPCCGSGGMFVQSEKFILRHGGTAADISVYGQELNQNTWKMAKMNLAIHGIDGDLSSRWADTFHDDRHPDMRADYILANPPFNISDWGGDRLGMDARWEYGTPPVGNANYAWLQHIAHKLAPRGIAGVVLANGSMSSKQSGEGDIRRVMVEEDLVMAMVALPGQIFRTTQIPACLWFLAKDKGPQGSAALTDRRGDVLFVDARSMGSLVNRTERVLSDEELAKIAGTVHAWRGRKLPGDPEGYQDEPGFCYSATIAEIREHDFALTPGRYVGAVEAEEDSEPVGEKIERLTKALLEHFDESARLEKVVREMLGRV